MQKITLNEIASIICGKSYIENDNYVNEIILDSRSILSTKETLFFAIIGERHNGHDFIKDLYSKGVKNFIISCDFEKFKKLEDTNFIFVKDTLFALQTLGEFFREKFKNPVLSITGSNGKTITKEWLYELLHKDIKIVRSPKSFNSQIGVPLSACLLENKYDLGILEAGISKIGEMENLEKIIKPDIGIFTNISNAHQENFPDIETKISEKLELFKATDLIIYCSDYKEIDEAIKNDSNLCTKTLFTWSHSNESDIEVIESFQINGETKIKVKYKDELITFKIPFSDKASIENALNCLSYIISTGLHTDFDYDKFEHLPSVEMRLEIKKGISNCTLINDTYNSDINSLKIALDLLNNQNQHERKTLILSDILQTGINEKDLYKEVAQLLQKNNIHRFIGIGNAIENARLLFSEINQTSFYYTTKDFLEKNSIQNFNNEAILIKGSRSFTFENISDFLQQKKHRTELEINLNAIIHNLNFYRSIIPENTKIMVMVKAFSYGSGSYEIANILQHNRVDYLGVAFADEGIRLREGGISLPIIVMNPETQSFRNMIDYKLEPEIYSFEILDEYVKYGTKYSNKPLAVHLKIDTGMKRLGFSDFEIDELLKKIKTHKNIYVKSIFSHLVATGEHVHDDFTNYQINKFKEISSRIINELNYPVIRHILNSSGIERFPAGTFDMVRLGIGLYGFSPSEQDKLMNVSTLKSKISQIKSVRKGETIGYSRKGVAIKDSEIAIIPVGYADGLNRNLSNGKGKLLIKGKRVPIIGNICMDMCMVDITGLEAKTGDEVIIFGDKNPANELANELNTIPYEIITGISDRVKRVYYH